MAYKMGLWKSCYLKFRRAKTHCNVWCCILLFLCTLALTFYSQFESTKLNSKVFRLRERHHADMLKEHWKDLLRLHGMRHTHHNHGNK